MNDNFSDSLYLSNKKRINLETAIRMYADLFIETIELPLMTVWLKDKIKDGEDWNCVSQVHSGKTGICIKNLYFHSLIFNVISIFNSD